MWGGMCVELWVDGWVKFSMKFHSSCIHPAFILHSHCGSLLSPLRSPSPLLSGLPKGVLNVVHDTHPTVNRILDHPDIKAVSFVGGSAAGCYIYERGAANGKRVQVRAACIWQ